MGFLNAAYFHEGPSLSKAEAKTQTTEKGGIRLGEITVVLRTLMAFDLVILLYVGRLKDCPSPFRTPLKTHSNHKKSLSLSGEFESWKGNIGDSLVLKFYPADGETEPQVLKRNQNSLKLTQKLSKVKFLFVWNFLSFKPRVHNFKGADHPALEL